MKWFVKIIGILAFVTATGIVPADAAEQAQLVVYLEGAENIDRRIELTLDNITLDEPNQVTEITPLHSKILSRELANRQMMLVEQEIDPGTYTSLTLHFSHISAYAGEAQIYPHIDTAGTSIKIHTEVEPRSALSLFLYWEPSRYDYDSLYYRPNFTIIQKEAAPVGAAVYVSNEGSGNISVIDRQTKRVTDVIKIGSHPVDMAFSSGETEIFVVDSGSQTIDLIDVFQHTIEKSWQLRFNDRPSRLLLTPDFTSLYVLLSGSQSLGMFNPRSLQQEERFDISSNPSSIAYDELSQTIYVADNYTGEILKINPYLTPNIATLPVSAAISDLVVDSRENLIYAAHATSGTISVLQSQTGAVVRAIKICSPANSMVYDNVSRTLYAAMEDCEEIAVIKPDQGLEIGSIRLTSRPGRIFLDFQTRNLLITLPDERFVAWCNVNARKISAFVPVGKNPTMVLVPR